MSEFVDAFNSLKKEDKISTHLSSSAFKNAVKKINAHTSISASYQVNWNAINCQALAFLFVFNPEISTTKIERIMERFPFIVISKTSYPHSITGFFVLPKVYLEELKNLLNKMEEHGYLIEKRLMNLESYSLFVNLNYLRDCFSKESLLDPKLNIYNDEYEIEFKMNFKGKKLVEQLGPLDFMILDKMRVNSIAGFGLEKYARLINDLKDEFRNEFLRMEKNILDFKQLIDLILKTKGMASIILKLIEKYKKKGFFGMSDWNKEIVKLMLKIPDCLYNEKGLNALDLIDNVPDYNESRLISIGNIVVNSKLVKEMVSLYRKSRKDFQEALNARQVLIKLLNVMEELKIFDLSIIRKLIKEPKILESIYEKKLSKLRDEMRRMKSIKFSLKLIDEKIRMNLGGYPVIIKPSDSGSTIGLSYVRDASELEDALNCAINESQRFLVEEYIPGRELTVPILRNKPLPIVEIKPTNLLYDYACKYTKGKSQYNCPAAIPTEIAERIKQEALLAFNSLGCEGYGRVDLRYNKGKAYYLEVNSLPGMTGLSLVPMSAKVAGIGFDELIDNILTEGLKKGVKNGQQSNSTGQTRQGA